MTYKVQYLTGTTTHWNTHSTHIIEQAAITSAQSLSRRSNVSKVRVINEAGSAIWMA